MISLNGTNASSNTHELKGRIVYKGIGKLRKGGKVHFHPVETTFLNDPSPLGK